MSKLTLDEQQNVVRNVLIGQQSHTAGSTIGSVDILIQELTRLRRVLLASGADQDDLSAVADRLEQGIRADGSKLPAKHITSAVHAVCVAFERDSPEAHPEPGVIRFDLGLA